MERLLHLRSSEDDHKLFGLTAVKIRLDIGEHGSADRYRISQERHDEIRLVKECPDASTVSAEAENTPVTSATVYPVHNSGFSMSIAHDPMSGRRHECLGHQTSG